MLLFVFCAEVSMFFFMILCEFLCFRCVLVHSVQIYSTFTFDDANYRQQTNITRENNHIDRCQYFGSFCAFNIEITQ